MKTLTELSIEKNRVSFTIFIVFVVLGVLAYYKMPRAKDPDFAIHTGVVTTLFLGASPERVESLVTIPLERQLRQIEGIDHIESVSKNGMSSIYITVKDSYKNVDKVWDDVRKEIANTRLPQEVQKPMFDENYSEVFGTLVTLVGDGFSYAELERIANDVKEEFLNIPDAGSVNILGMQKEHIFIEFSNAKLAELGLSPDYLAKIIRERNSITPVGTIKVGPKRLVVQPNGSIQSLEALKKTIIPLPGRKDVVYLEDIASIKTGYSQPKDPFVRADGEQGLILAVSVAKTGDIIALGRAIKEKLAKFNQRYPIGIEFNFAFDEPKLVDHIIGNFIGSLVISVVIILIVMLITLGWRTGLIVSSLIPATILVSFFFMEQFDIGFNQVSLAALIISLGLLVDNAIVMSESIVVKIDEGKSPLQAAVESVKELRISLLTSSLTTAAAFLPIYLAESAASEYTADLFKVVTITLLVSWVLSLTMIPILAYFFLPKHKKRHTFSYNNPFCNTYKKLLTLSLKHRDMAVAGIVLLFVLALLASNLINKNFFPPSEQPSMVIRITMPEGTDIEETLKSVKDMEMFLREKQPELVKNFTSFVGSGGPRFWINNTPVPASSNYAEILVNATSLDAYKELQKQIANFEYNHFADADVSVKKLDNGPPVKSPVQIRIIGKDIDYITELSKKIKNRLSESGLVYHISDDWGDRTPVVLVDINPSLAYHAGVSYNDVARSLQTAIKGRDISEFRTDTKAIPITLRSTESINSSINALRNTLIFIPGSDKSVPLTQVADVDVLWKPPKIVRYNTVHTITVQTELLDGVTAFDVQEFIDPYLRSLSWKEGYHFEYGGEIESSKKAQGAITQKLPIAILIILLLLVAQFNSYKRTLLILLTIPLGIIGVIFGLLLTHSYFGFMTYLGVISLIGIVINNAIILIERIEYEKEVLHNDPKDAIIEAAQRRMRPILLTTLTTIGGLVPLWISGGPLWEPMAVALIFGLAFGTVLTLGVVPIFYAILFGIKYPKDYNYRYQDACIYDALPKEEAEEAKKND